MASYKNLLLGGTAAGVGKSFIAAGLGRILARRGLLGAPFKAEERSCDTLPASRGGDIGYASALQAAACGLEPHVDMNPLLLKREGADSLQLWLQGQFRGRIAAAEYQNCKTDFSPLINESCHRLQAQVDLLLIEGEGNYAESALLGTDIANQALAEAAPTAVILVADAEQGGAFAALTGTVELLSDNERARLQGMIINKAPLERSQLSAGIEQLERRTGLPLLGVVPRLDVQLEKTAETGSDERENNHGIRVGVVKLPHGNSSELIAELSQEQDLLLDALETPEQLEGVSLLLLPDSESVRGDLEFLQQSGLAAAIRRYHAAGGRVVGIGGGFHLLAEKISDPQGELAGLGLLDLDFQLFAERRTQQVRAHFQQAAYAAGFGGMADLDACLVEVAECGYGVISRPLMQLSNDSESAGFCTDGAVSADGRVWGTGLRNFLADDRVRYALLAPLRAGRSTAPETSFMRQRLDAELDRLAAELERYLDLEQICVSLGLS